MTGHRFCVAPMMDWTDRHCRAFHRVLTHRALVYTEMVTSAAVIHGDREHLLGFDDSEQPVAVQLGGSEPGELAEAARICRDVGYREVNLNVGCPSDRVQSGRFGACLMAEPHLVARCVEAMRQAVDIPVTVKCRIGIDDQDDETALDNFVSAISGAGCTTVIVHARKAWLQGLSPKENREIPPLNYDRVYRLKRTYPELEVIINGGIEDLDACADHLRRCDGVMLGRAAYRTPWVLADVDRRLFGSANPTSSRYDAVERFMPYIDARLGEGVPLQRMTRHMLGLFHGQPGGRLWRRVLSEEAHRDDAGAEVIRRALDQVGSQPVLSAAE